MMKSARLSSLRRGWRAHARERRSAAEGPPRATVGRAAGMRSRGSGAVDRAFARVFRYPKNCAVTVSQLCRSKELDIRKYVYDSSLSLANSRIVRCILAVVESYYYIKNTTSSITRIVSLVCMALQ